jgi:hypothetical protein
MLERYADLKVLRRIHNRRELSGRRITQDTSVDLLSRRERERDAQEIRRPDIAFNESTIDPIFQVDVDRKTPRSAPSPSHGGKGEGEGCSGDTPT